ARWGDTGVPAGDPTAHECGTVPLAVAEPRLEQRQRGGARDAEQLLHGERVHARLGEVEAHAVLPRALPALQLERDETHWETSSETSDIRHQTSGSDV